MLLTRQYIDKAFWKKLIAIGVPVSLQSMLFSLLGAVDIFMVSQLGESATAAVGVGNRIFFFNLAVVFWIVWCSNGFSLSILWLWKPLWHTQNARPILVYFASGDSAIHLALYGL